MNEDQFINYLYEMYGLTLIEAAEYCSRNKVEEPSRELAVKVRNFIEQEWHDTSSERWEEDEERARDIEEYNEDLEARGFFNGTDDSYADEMITQGQIMQDKIDMYRNEY